MNLPNRNKSLRILQNRVNALNAAMIELQRMTENANAAMQALTEVSDVINVDKCTSEILDETLTDLACSVTYFKHHVTELKGRIERFKLASASNYAIANDLNEDTYLVEAHAAAYKKVEGSNVKNITAQYPEVDKRIKAIFDRQTLRTQLMRDYKDKMKIANAKLNSNGNK